MNDNERTYSKAFYTEDTLLKAINAYSNISKIELFEEDKEHYRCRFSESSIDCHIVMNEFDNYLIEIMNSKSL